MPEEDDATHLGWRTFWKTLRPLLRYSEAQKASREEEALSAWFFKDF